MTRNSIDAKIYIKINLIIAGILGLLFLYSGIFSADGINHPIPSMSTVPSVSTGLSRAFSAILRLNFEQALAFNPYSLKIFTFFFIQLLMRISLSGLLLYNRVKHFYVLIIDVLLTVLLFLWAFYNYVLGQFALL